MNFLLRDKEDDDDSQADYDSCRLGCYTLHFCRNVPTFLTNLQPPSSTKWKRPLVHQTSVHFCQNIRRHIAQDWCLTWELLYAVSFFNPTLHTVTVSFTTTENEQ